MRAAFTSLSHSALLLSLLLLLLQLNLATISHVKTNRSSHRTCAGSCSQSMALTAVQTAMNLEEKKHLHPFFSKAPRTYANSSIPLSQSYIWQRAMRPINKRFRLRPRPTTPAMTSSTNNRKTPLRDTRKEAVSPVVRTRRKKAPKERINPGWRSLHNLPLAKLLQWERL